MKILNGNDTMNANVGLLIQVWFYTDVIITDSTVLLHCTVLAEEIIRLDKDH